MKERPILFSGSMVRAILDGRKTQTRRVVKPADLARVGADGVELWTGFMGWQPADIVLADQSLSTNTQTRCPYGQPGDRLWVREAFSGPHCMEAWNGNAAVPPSKWATCSSIWYWADGNPDAGDWTRPRPSIHMPRWASRITLEITGVRVERLNDCSEADAIAEGIVPRPGADGEWAHYADTGLSTDAIGSYRSLWEQINGPASWDDNPWVWVVEFQLDLSQIIPKR